VSAGGDLDEILAEVHRASAEAACAYILGAAHDGTVNRLHGTLRITQADQRWLDVLAVLLVKLGKRSWTYREGARSVWTLETTHRPHVVPLASDDERSAFVRGYFDAEGGVPRSAQARFYIQFVQKNKPDLCQVRAFLGMLGIMSGRMHNPSPMVDSDYWRFYVRAASCGRFIDRVSSWHPRKRAILEERRPEFLR